MNSYVKQQLAIVAVVLFLGAFFFYYGYKSGKSPTKEEYYTIDAGTFDNNIIVFVTKDTALVRQFSAEMDFNSSACTVDEDGVIMVWFPTFPDSALLSHELTHVNEFLLKDVGVPHSDDTDEVYAYEMGYLTKQFYKNVKHD
jgi:hypothetical protein